MTAAQKRPINHLYKRGLLIQATKQVMRDDGLAACTVRRVARETGYSAGTVHYYFDDMNELVDVAFLELTRDYVEAIRATDAQEPVDALWETIRRYLTPFFEHPGASRLWFDFAAARSTGSSSATLVASIGAVRELFAARIRAAVPGAGDLDGPLVSLLLGQLLLLRSRPDDLHRLSAAIGGMLGVPVPEGFALDAPCAICTLNRRPAKVARIVWN